MAKRGLTFQLRASDKKARPPVPRRPPMAGVGRLRKIACLGGAASLQHAPWHDLSWELWAQNWDPKYPDWLKGNHVPIMMQDRYKDVPASIKYPFATMITEFPRGYMTNTMAYMIALALMEGVTHLGVFGCDYRSNSEYGPQRGGAEYWLGVAEGRGVQVLLPPGCDLLNKPSLLYGYESHPNGVRHPSYSFSIGPLVARVPDKPSADGPTGLIPSDHPNAPPLRDIGVPPEPWSPERAWA